MLRPSNAEAQILITGGKGVGRVTKPGLEVPPGEFAINSGPRAMILEVIRDVLKIHPFNGDITVEIFIPKGEILAQKTLNQRLGIIGGLSILGTTGIVRPMSHAAYLATIKSALSVARAGGGDHVVMTTGRRSERYAQNVLPTLAIESFVQIGDFFQAALDMVLKLGFQSVTLAVFFGKAVKMAQGAAHTHAHQSSIAMSELARWTAEVISDKHIVERVANANTARHAFDIFWNNSPQMIDVVGQKMLTSARKFTDHRINVNGIIFNFEGIVVFDSRPLNNTHGND